MRGRGFDSVRDLWLRTGLPPKALEKLAHADAFNSLGLSRRDALWAVKALQRAGDKDDLPLFARVRMPALEPDAHLAVDAAGRAGDRGLSPSASVPEGASGVVPAPRSRRARHRASRAACHLVPGRRVTIGGIVLVRQRPGTGNAIFMTLEDETGDRQHHRLAAQVRGVSSGGDGRAADQRDRRAAERERT